ncbi:MAG: response regulator [Patescibacteria group bacterium]|nr:response regulator [Patescibacteria group bacterium]MDE2588099.1 response regulator [Patescibacteria group bacterium]
MKVLLVDDEQSLLDVFSQTLESGGFQVITSLNGKDGIEKAKESMPDMILLDQVLPDMAGNEVLQMLKSIPTTKEIPVAILSNFNQRELVQDAINLGAVDYILKYKIEPKDLIEKVNQTIEEHRSNSAVKV